MAARTGPQRIIALPKRQDDNCLLETLLIKLTVLGFLSPGQLFFGGTLFSIVGYTEVIRNDDSAGFASWEIRRPPPNPSPDEWPKIGPVDECLSALSEKCRRPVAL